MRGKDNARSGGEILIDQLSIHGVRDVFCVPGESYLAALDAFYGSDIKLTVCRHESTAAMMAEVVGKMTGRPGICFVTRGPGASNASGGIHIARQDSSPMIMFVGQVGRDMRDREAFQELDYRAVFGTMAKWATEIDDPARIPEIVSRAFHTACNGRPGPVVIALPEDMLTERIAVSDASRFEPVETSPGQSEMSRLQDLLRSAKHPVVLIGGSRWSEQASASLMRFAERFALPVATTFRRGHLVDAMHPCYAGDFGIGPNPKLLARVKGADLVLLIGGRFSEMPSQSYSVFDIPEPQTKLVHVHPGADELGRVYHPHLAINATPTAFCAALDSLQPPKDIAWRGDSDTAHADFLAWGEKATTVPGAVNLGEIMVWLRNNLPADAIITQGAGNFSGWVHRFYRVRKFGGLVGRDLGLDGLRLARCIGDADDLSRSHCCLRRRRRRFPHDGTGFCDGCPIQAARHRAGRRQRHLRHHPHAPGARVSGPRCCDRPAQSGFRGLRIGIRRLRRGGGEERGLPGGLCRRARLRQTVDHPSQDRPRGDHPGDDALRNPGKIAHRRRWEKKLSLLAALATPP